MGLPVQYLISFFFWVSAFALSFRLDYVEIDLPPSTNPPIVYRRCTPALLIFLP